MNDRNHAGTATIGHVLQELTALRSAMVAESHETVQRVEDAHVGNRDSARNLLHYLARRGRDLRSLQHGLLARFFDFLDQRVGMDNVLVVLTADHGFPNVPEFAQSQHLDARRLNGDDLIEALNRHLAEKFSVDKLVAAWSLPNLYLDNELAEKNGIKRETLENAAARFLLARNGIAAVYTRTQLENSAAGGTRIDLLMRRAWNRQISGDLMVVTRPYWYFGSGNSGTSHGSPYAYDTNVPLILMGKRWISPGAYTQYAEAVDIAPTLAHLLQVRPPAASEGRILTETLR